MIQNYLKVALRKLSKQRTYALLNIFGLGLSVGCGILIFTLIRHHLSFDTYHKNAERIARVVMDIKTENVMPFPGAPNPMAKTLLEECPIVENAALRSAEEEVLISINNKAGGKDKYKEEGQFAWVDPSYFDILDLPLIRGNLAALSEPNTVIISERLAQKYFGNAEALGQSIKLNNDLNLRIIGILQNLPVNTDYKHEILASMAGLKALPGNDRELQSWNGARGDNFCLVLLKAGHQVAELDPVMTDFIKRHPHSESADLFQYKAKSLKELHFDDDYGRGIEPKLLWALGFIGLFLLITACVNFINMATAQALTRVREVGVRKSLGSTRGQLFWQFMSETGLIVGASLVAGYVIALLAVPYLNTWLDEHLQLNGPQLGTLLAFTLVLGLVLTFLAGFYPGLLQARFNPVASMKGAGEIPSTGGFSMRRILVTTQFAISQMLIIGAAVVTAQMHYAQEADWGFQPGAVLTVEIPDRDKKNSLYQQISQIAGVQNVSLCYQPPASGSNNFSGLRYENKQKDEPWIVNDKPADVHYLETFGLKLAAGRNMEPSDTVRELLVNETIVKKLNLASPEEILNITLHIGGEKGKVVGVVRDFHNWSLAEPIAPIAFSTHSDSYSTCAIQLAPGNPAPVLAKIRQAWEQQFPEHYFESKFMDERVREQLESETLIMRLVGSFAGIAIFIGCLGLYGLAAFLVNQKRKEVGIRKTLGASISGILWLFGKEYARLIIIAFALAAPLAWWVMDGWLSDYAYRISVGAGIFVVSLLVTFGVAALTVGFQSIRAALANPVTSLRSE